MSEERTRSYSAEELGEMESKTDWEALREKTDEEIEQAVREDPDAVLLGEDIIEHFKRGGAGYQSRINDVLRAYVTSKRLEGESSE